MNWLPEKCDHRLFAGGAGRNMERSKKIPALRFLLFTFLFQLYPAGAKTSLPSEDLFSEENIARIQNIIDHTINQKYEKAFQLCQELQQQYPTHPAGYFFEAATLQAEMLDFENNDQRDRFFRLTAQVADLCKAGLRNDPQNGWLYFFLGGALGYDAYFFGREQKYLKAFSDGWNSIQALETAVALDSSNYDAYLGIGTYKYYRSKLSKFLNWLPFVRDEKETGIELIELAIEKGKFSSAAAMNALIWIYIGEEKYAQADEWIEKALGKYPESRFFLWGKATVAMKQKRWSQAEIVYQQILQSYATAGKRSFYNELVCHASLAEIYAHRKMRVLACEHAQKALAIKIQKPVQKKVRKYRKSAEKILKQHDRFGEMP
jgi:tetratricopeptide (TPR) repeat protein